VTVFVVVARAPRAGWRFIKSRRPSTGEPPRTGLNETILDLCAQADPDEMTAIVADAISSRRTSAKRLLAELARRPRQRNRTTLREVLGDVSRGAHSALGRRCLIDVERAHALPEAARQQHPMAAHRTDGWYREYGLLVELDSTLHHSGGATFRDMSRENDHALLGLTTFRFGWRHVTGVAACHTARLISQFVLSRGWEGPLRPCRRCRRVPPAELIQIRAR